MNRVASLILLAATALGCGAARPPSSIVDEAREVPGTLVIEPPAARYVSDLDPQQRRDQVRDWAVFATVTHLGASPVSAASATYELPPARLPYLDELYSFEYGAGRRSYLDGRVLLFRDADDPDPQATIGRLADRIRMESGEVPASVEVFAIHDLENEGRIQVVRLPDVTRDELFSSAYGYVEGTASDAASLAVWLESIDDLSSARITEGRLVLGGRRFAGTRTQNLTAEDVAALYQAHDELDQPRRQAQQWLATRSAQTRRSIERVIDLKAQGRTVSSEALHNVYESIPESENHGARDAIRALANEASPGFSLDPAWLPDRTNPTIPLVLTKLRAFTANPCKELQQIANDAEALAESDDLLRSFRADAVTIRDLISEHGPLSPDICTQIGGVIELMLRRLTTSTVWFSRDDWELARATYYSMSRRLEAASTSKRQDSSVRALARAVLDYYDVDTSVQCGTYFGLRGTRVGMTLFYTDLLAKLWGSDYDHSAPTGDVLGFQATPFINLPPSFADELQQNSYTRLWFGPRSDSVSRIPVGDAQTLLFDHRFTRIYAAGSDPGRPGVEGQPPESERRSIGWWDRHFDEIADFEQEYHRQNQIMKWAVVAGAFADSSVIAFLKEVRVDRSLDFHTWHAATRDHLRFSDPLPKAAAIAGKECLPLFSSYPFESAGGISTISGGVTTVARSSTARVPEIRGLEPLGARRPYVADIGAGQAGTSVRPLPTRSGQDVTFFNAANARTRAATGDVPLGAPTVKYGGTPAKLEVHAGSGERAIGTLELEVKSASRVKMGWRDGPVEMARPDVSVPISRAGADKLAASGHIDDAAQVYQRVGAAASRTADDLARQLVVDTARRRATPVLRTLQKLETKGAQLAPETRSAVESAVARIGSDTAAKQVSTALRTGKPLSSVQGQLVVERGRIIVTRDVAKLPPARPSSAPADLSRAEVYIDSRLRVGREGLVPDTGVNSAYWRSRPDVTIDALDRSAIGALPDRLVVSSTKLRLNRVTNTSAGLDRNVVFIIRPASTSSDGDRAGRRRTCDKDASPNSGNACAQQR
jgi:hypothetical protein